MLTKDKSHSHAHRHKILYLSLTRKYILPLFLLRYLKLTPYSCLLHTYVMYVDDSIATYIKSAREIAFIENSFEFILEYLLFVI